MTEYKNFTVDLPKRIAELDPRFRQIASCADLDVSYTLMKLAASFLLTYERIDGTSGARNAQILALIESLKADLRMSVLFITHDLGIVAQTADQVVVMYAGQVVETAPVADIFDRPAHPYTMGLLRSIPRMKMPGNGSKKRLQEIRGSLPSLDRPLLGCRFADRCPDVFEPCRQKRPVLLPIQDGQQARCWLYADESDKL